MRNNNLKKGAVILALFAMFTAKVATAETVKYSIADLKNMSIETWADVCMNYETTKETSYFKERLEHAFFAEYQKQVAAGDKDTELLDLKWATCEAIYTKNNPLEKVKGALK